MYVMKIRSYLAICHPRRLLGTMPLIALLALAQGAAAQEKATGWYAAGRGGVALPQSLLAQRAPVTRTFFDNGYVFAGAVGRHFGGRFDGWSVELEGLHTATDVDKLTFAGVSENASGSYSTWALLANGSYELPIADSRWRPYLGGGVGFARVKPDGVASASVRFRDQTETELAFTARAGVAYSYDEATTVSVGYRLFGTQVLDLSDTGGQSFENDGLVNHNVELGVRFDF